MTEHDAVELIAASLSKLMNEDMISRDTIISRDLILLGPGSPLDSIGFVTFVTDLEERVSTNANKDIYLVLSEINGFDINQSHLLVADLARYLIKLSEEK